MHSSPRTLSWFGRLAVAGVLGARAFVTPTTFVAPTSFVEPTTFAEVMSTESEIALGLIQTAAEAIDYRAVQTRRVLSPARKRGDGREWVGAVEDILHRSDRGSSGPEKFNIRLRGFEGVSMSADALARLQLHYGSQAAYLFRFQSFRVLDARLAANNYVVQALVRGSDRARRRCNRVAVISRTPDRPSWLLDLDATNNFPLYCGEFTSDGQLVAELEVSVISYGAAAQIPADDGWAWSPRQHVAEFATTAEARSQALGIEVLVIEATDLGAGYLLDHARVISDPMIAEQVLVQVFHDGIDALFIRQRTLPELPGQGHTARFYAEAGVQQCLFQQKRTEFLFVGRNARLRSIVTRVHRMAVATL